MAKKGKHVVSSKISSGVEDTKIFKDVREAAAAFGITNQAIYYLIKNQRMSRGGHSFRWSYPSETEAAPVAAA